MGTDRGRSSLRLPAQPDDRAVVAERLPSTKTSTAVSMATARATRGSCEYFPTTACRRSSPNSSLLGFAASVIPSV
jgi:hypothetical protein